MTQAIKLKTILLALLVGFGLVLSPLMMAPVSADEHDTTGSIADSKDEACEAVGALGQECDEAAEAGVLGVIKEIINILSLIIGIAAVVILIVSGLRFVVSGGNATALQSARNGMIFALIGLVIVVLAQSIVAFVLNRL